MLVGLQSLQHYDRRSGSVRFWYGSGSVPLTNWSGSWPFRQWSSRYNHFIWFFCLLLFGVTFTSFFKDNKNHNIRSKVFFEPFLLDSDQYLRLTDQGGPKTEGFGPLALMPIPMRILPHSQSKFTQNVNTKVMQLDAKSSRNAFWGNVYVTNYEFDRVQIKIWRKISHVYPKKIRLGPDREALGQDPTIRRFHRIRSLLTHV